MIKIELYITRTQILTMRSQGLSDTAIAKELELDVQNIQPIVDRKQNNDFRVSCGRRGEDDYGALLSTTPLEKHKQMFHKLVDKQARKMGYRFSEERFDQIFDAAYRAAE